MTLTEEQGGFDLEKARDALDEPICPAGQHRVVLELQGALAEIERLRAEISEQKGMIWKTQQAEKEQATRIEELEADLEEAQESLTEAYLLGSHEKAKELASRIKELEDELEQSERVIEARLEVIEAKAIQIKALERSSINQAARIRELEKNCIYDPEQGKIFVPDGYPELEKLRARVSNLEDALVEERARALWLVGDDPCDPPDLDWENEPNDIPESVQQLWEKSALAQLRAECKIGPDAKPRSWQITAERKAAIRDAEIALRDAVLDSNDIHCWDAETAVLRAMLREAE